MNKNPFVTTAAYTPHQPPLPPGPPPPQPAQQDYSAYWAAATAAQHAQAPTVGAYNAQWSAGQAAQPAAPRPTPEQSALYANYGYGGQQNLAWQQQQRQPQQHFQPPPPVVQPPPPPPPQPAYNPYQPQAGAYQQPYVPQAGPTPQQVQPTPYQPQMAPQPFQQPHQQFFPQQQQQQQQQQQRPNNRNHNIHHTSPQQLPPAKRQRFDGPSQHRPPAPPQPQFQPPPPPPPIQQQQQQGGGMGMFGQGQQGHGRGGGPGMNQMSGNMNRGGFNGGRGGNSTGGRGRGMPMGMNRGGNRGRGGGAYNNMGGRGGNMGQTGGSFRGHGSNRGFGNRDNRRGGSFSGGGGQGYSHGFQQQSQHHHHQQMHHQHHQNFSQGGSFRGRNQGFSQSSRGGRHDSATAHGSRDGGSGVSTNFSSGFVSGKKDENRRTLTDFKIVALEIPELSWNWGIAKPDSIAPSIKVEALESVIPLTATANPQLEQDSTPVKAEDTTSGADAALSSSTPVAGDVHGEGAPIKSEPTALLPPPPSRIRIYFHTPVTADDAHLLPSQSLYSPGPSSTSAVRKGKRKKLEDDDGDLEDGRGAPPPPPHSSGMDSEHDGASVAPSAEYDGTETVAGRDSVAPSVAETASEGDWLMAAIGGEEGQDEDLNHDHANDGDQYHDPDADAEGEYEGNGYDDMQGEGHDEYHMLGGDEDAHGSVDEQHNEHAHVAEQGDMPTDPSGPNGIVSHDDSGLPSASDVPTRASSAQQDNDVGMGAAQQAESLTTQDNGAAPRDESSASHDVSTSVATQSHSQSVDIADGSHNDDAQASSQVAGHLGGMPLQAMDSIASTVPDTNGENPNPNPNHESFTSTVVDEESGDTQQQATQPVEGFSQQEHKALRETSTSPDSNTVVSVAYTGSTVYNDPSASQATGKSSRVASANRLSVSYAAGTRRMVIDAEIVEKLKVIRAEGRIEVSVTVAKDGEDGYKGILMEAYSEATSSYLPLEISETAGADPTIPAFSRVVLPSKITLIAHLDRERPLSEPRWVKTGDVQEWLKSMFGRMFWVAGDAADGWERKIEVVDPDPAPTIWTILEAWAQNSTVGQPTERQRFLRTHMTETDNILEILLRLVRGERSTVHSHSQPPPALAAPNIAGPLLSALSPGAAHGAQQTHVSLAVLAIFRLAVEYAKRAAPESGKHEAEERVGEIIRCLPSHLLYKSLDGIFKEWKVEKKGGR